MRGTREDEEDEGRSGRADVVIITALSDELHALLALGEGGKEGWTQAQDSKGLPYFWREIAGPTGAPLRIAAATAAEMTGVPVATRTLALIHELSPDCLAMCGIAAGKRGDVSLGDVIVADRAYFYDHGKEEADRDKGGQVTLYRDIKTYNLDKAWKTEVELLAKNRTWGDALEALLTERPISKRAQRQWLLEALYAHTCEDGIAPQQRPDRKARCPSWGRAFLDELQKEGLLALQAGKLRLTDQGREEVLNERIYCPEGPPEEPPFQVHTAPIASGSAVKQDPALFAGLKPALRKTLGVEMEAAALAHVAAEAGLRWIVAKAVSDFGDHDKDDAFRTFAASVSAAFLLDFFMKHLRPARRERTWSDGAARGMEDFGNGRSEFVERVERVYKAKDEDATFERVRAKAPLAGILERTRNDAGYAQIYPIGVVDGEATEEAVCAFADALEVSYRLEDPRLKASLIHRGQRAPEALWQQARKQHGVVLKSFAELQGIIDFDPYLAWQTGRLEASGRYPSALYVEQHAKVSVAGQEPTPTDDALKALEELLDAEHPRFALILGDFGAGKTFLLHELARRMARDKHKATPVLVELRALEKAHALNPLLAHHLAKADLGRIDLRAFRYMLREGRVALLFDGFDELALRVSYDRALEHFATLAQAAEGNAKVVVTSRTQHFLTDTEVKKELAKRAEALPGYRLIKLLPFDKGQIRRFLVKRLEDEQAAEERFRLLDQVKDLLGLSENPRMLSFIAEIPAEALEAVEKREAKITSAALYALLIERWLAGEHARANPKGAPDGLSLEQLRAGAVELAKVLWARVDRSVRLQDLPAALFVAVQAGGERPAVDAELARHQIGSGSLLVRDELGTFSFLHQSVLEWLVAKEAAEEVRQSGTSVLLRTGEMSDLMADFFADLAGHDHALGWARRVLEGGGEEMAKKNGTRVLRRLEKPATEPVPDDEIEITEDEPVFDFSKQNLSGQDFSGQKLRGASFREANLWNATLSNADLTNTDLSSAKLGRADLSKAVLVGANLRGADLQRASLLGADLRGARLEGAALVAAKLVGAKMDALSPEAWRRLVEAGAALPEAGVVEPMIVASASPCGAVARSAGGDWIAAGYEDGTILLWDVRAGLAVRRFRGHRAPVTSVAFDPTGITLASGSQDTTVRLWDVNTGRELRSFGGHKATVLSVAFGPAGNTLASGSQDTTVWLWDVNTGRPLRCFEGHTNAVMSVAFDPAGITLASGSQDATVRLWDVNTGRQLRSFKGHTNAVMSVAFDPAGITLASGSQDATVRLWDVNTGRELRSFKGHTDWVLSVAFDPAGITLASGSQDATVRLWDVNTGRELRSFKGHTDWVLSVAFDPAGITLASGSQDATVRLWNVNTGRPLRSFGGYKAQVWSVAFDPAGNTLASGSQDATVQLWDINTGRELRSFEGHRAAVLAVAFDPVGHTVASGSQDNTVRLWDVNTGLELRSFEGHRAAILSVAFDPAGNTLASGSQDNTVRLWDVNTGRQLRSFGGHTYGVQSVAFDPAGNTLASGSHDEKVRLWDVNTGRQLRSFEGHTYGVQSVAFNPAGNTLASGSYDGEVRLWDVNTGRQLRSFEGHTYEVQSVAFDPAGNTLASGSRDATVRLWDVNTGRQLRSFEGYAGPVGSIAFSPDGKTLASASSDGTLRLWHVATGDCLAILYPTEEGWAAFTPDGRYKLGGAIGGSFWHVIGLCRFEPGELDPYLPRPLRVPDDEPLFTTR